MINTDKCKHDQVGIFNIKGQNFTSLIELPYPKCFHESFTNTVDAQKLAFFPNLLRLDDTGTDLLTHQCMHM